MLQRKSVLARLLANEDITVQQGNFKTAFFDVENRVLGLPLWKEMSGDLYDLLVGHEVGHALFTPPMEEVLIEGVPFAYVNVVEDIRIEKAMLAKYPGLVNNFKRGYQELVDVHDLFGTKERDVNSMGFMDRLNIKAKGRDLVDVEFSEEEMPYFEMAMNVETFKDVENVCKALVDWIGGQSDDSDQQEEQPKAKPITSEQLQDLLDQIQSQSQDPSDNEEEGEDGDDGEGNDQSDEEGTESGSSGSEEGDEESGETGNGVASSEDGEKSDGDIEKSITGKGADNSPDSLPEVETDKAQRNNMEKLVVDDGTVFAHGMSRQAFDVIKVPYKDILADRSSHNSMLIERGYGEHVDLIGEGFEEFLGETKKVVNLMAKEFEMRKAAYRSARARTSTKGSLDVNKLHAYKYDDQLFKQVTSLADGKNHGMIMLVDYSGSMHGAMPSVMRQTVALVMFCKRVGIPFEVYGFTSSNRGTDVREAVTKASTNLTRLEVEELQLNQLFSSKMPKRDYEEALKGFYISGQHGGRYNCGSERLGSTPLNTALLASQYIIEDFMKSSPVHKLNFVTLTDGDSDNIYLRAGVDSNGYGKNIVTQIKGKNVELEKGWGTSKANTAKILEAVTGPNITTANFFICSRRDFKQEMYRVLPWKNDAQAKARKEMKDNGVWIIKDCDGYDSRFVMIDTSSKMSGANEDFDVDTEATPAQIARAFKKFSGSKKGNRVVTQKFAELVA